MGVLQVPETKDRFELVGPSIPLSNFPEIRKAAPAGLMVGELAMFRHFPHRDVQGECLRKN